MVQPWKVQRRSMTVGRQRGVSMNGCGGQELEEWDHDLEERGGEGGGGGVRAGEAKGRRQSSRAAAEDLTKSCDTNLFHRVEITYD